MHPIYTVEYFINKFSAIPEHEWHVGDYSGKTGAKCALGHCQHGFSDKNKEETGSYYGAEYVALLKLFGDPPTGNDNSFIAIVNDGKHEKYKQPNAKQRVLAALYDLKNPEQPKVKEVIRYVSVSESLKKQTKELIEN